MKAARLLGLLMVGMFLVPFAYADGPVTMVFTGVNGVNDGHGEAVDGVGDLVHGHISPPLLCTATTRQPLRCVGNPQMGSPWR